MSYTHTVYLGYIHHLLCLVEVCVSLGLFVLFYVYELYLTVCTAPRLCLVATEVRRDHQMVVSYYVGSGAQTQVFCNINTWS